MPRLVLLLVVAACSRPVLVVHGPGKARVDAVIVPGCPTAADGTLSGCLKERALWAAYLWQHDVTGAFITTGAPTYNRYSEAEALAAGMTAAGVPAELIWLEEQARHTDENMFHAWIIASHFGWDELAVASHGGHASGACGFLDSWGQPCVASALDAERVRAMAREPIYAGVHTVAVAPVPEAGWLAVGEWEAAREASGGPGRPSSIVLYTWAPVMRAFGRPWVPEAPPLVPPVRYRDRLAARGLW